MTDPKLREQAAAEAKIEAERIRLEHSAGNIHAKFMGAADNVGAAKSRADQIWDDAFIKRLPFYTNELSSDQKRHALDTIATLIVQCETKLPKWVAEVTAIRDKARAEKDARDTAQREAEENRFARGMSTTEVLDYLEGKQCAVLKLDAASKILIAPAALAQDMKTRALIRLHYSALVGLLRSRTDFATVEPVA
jgi:hypothetical protein